MEAERYTIGGAMSPPNTVFETKRLRFRRLTMNDLDPPAKLYADPDVMRYIGKGGSRLISLSAVTQLVRLRKARRLE